MVSGHVSAGQNMSVQVLFPTDKEAARGHAMEIRSTRYPATVLVLVLCVFALPLLAADQGDRDDPLRWEDTIRDFEEAAALKPEPKDAVLFVGSSSIRRWSTLRDDMAPIPVIQRGFGGSRLADAAYYAERLVNVYRPRAVVLFSGTNDITPEYAKSPEALLTSYQEFVKKVRADLPNVPIYYVEITPSPLRWSVWNIAQETNRRIAKYSAQQKKLYVIDLSPFLLGANGQPDPKFYVDDRLHMSAAGDEIWTREIRKRLKADMPSLLQSNR
jgi:lysophospholipase L1-like esterase